MNEQNFRFWPHSPEQGDTIAVLPVILGSAENESPLLLLAAGSQQAFCFVTPADVAAFIHSHTERRLIVLNAAQLCNAAMATVTEPRPRRQLRRLFFQLADDSRYVDLRLLNTLVELATTTSYLEEPRTAEAILQIGSLQEINDSIVAAAANPQAVEYAANQAWRVLSAMLGIFRQLETRATSIAAWPIRSQNRHSTLLGVSVHVGSTLATNSGAPTVALDPRQVELSRMRWNEDLSSVRRKVASGPIADAFVTADQQVEIRNGRVVLNRKRFSELMRARTFNGPDGPVVSLSKDNGHLPPSANDWLDLQPYDESIGNWIGLETTAELLRICETNIEGSLPEATGQQFLANQLPRLNPHYGWKVWEQLISRRLVFPRAAGAYLLETPELPLRCLAKCRAGGRLEEIYRRSQKPTAVVRNAIMQRRDRFPVDAWQDMELNLIVEAMVASLELGLQTADIIRRCNRLRINGLTAARIENMVRLVSEVIPELAPFQPSQTDFADSPFRRRAGAPWSPATIGQLDFADDVRKAIWTKLGANGFELLAAGPNFSLIGAAVSSQRSATDIRTIAESTCAELLSIPARVRVTSYL